MVPDIGRVPSHASQIPFQVAINHLRLTIRLGVTCHGISKAYPLQSEEFLSKATKEDNHAISGNSGKISVKLIHMIQK